MIRKRSFWLLRLVRLFRRPKPPAHIWKVVREENLGSYEDYGTSPYDISTMYRIAVYEECVATGAKRVRERRGLFPVKDSA